MPAMKNPLTAARMAGERCVAAYRLIQEDALEKDILKLLIDARKCLNDAISSFGHERDRPDGRRCIASRRKIKPGT
jgi:hypothetical protein